MSVLLMKLFLFILAVRVTYWLSLSITFKISNSHGLFSEIIHFILLQSINES